MSTETVNQSANISGPKPADQSDTSEAAEEVVELPRAVPVFMTYFTVAPWGDGIRFRADPYGYDDRAMRQMFGRGKKVAAADL